MEKFDLDTPLIEFPFSKGTDYWTIRNAVEGVQIFGGIGSGKTSGSGRLLALKYLSAGFGGLVMTVKADERKMWEEFCRLSGREKDLIIIEPAGNQSFNFLDYESGHGTGTLAATENIVDVLKTVIKAGAAQDVGRTEDPFWESSLDLLLINSIDLCKLAYGDVSVQEMYDIVQTIPKKEDSQPSSDALVKAFYQAFEAARVNVTAQIDKWSATFGEDEKIRFQDDKVFERELLNAVPDARLLKFVDGFFVDNFISLSEKTRSIIELSFSSFLFRLLREPFYSLFCRNPSTVTPEDTWNGKIVLIDLPVKLHHKTGRDAQLIVKYCFQRAWEKRDISMNERPCFLWADEAQTFIHEKDAEFQATARSSRVATVYLSQNLPNYMASMGGQKAEYRVKAFLGTLGTKFFHGNADMETNEYSSKLIGDGDFEETTMSRTTAEHPSKTRGHSLKLERIVRPEQFVSLRTGGPRNNLRTEAYMHRQGNSFPTNYNHTKMTFNQNYRPDQSA